MPSCWGNSRIRWAQGAANRSIDFETVLNVGINGPAPPGSSTCATSVPALGPPMQGLLAAILLGTGAVVRAWQRRARV